MAEPKAEPQTEQELADYYQAHKDAPGFWDGWERVDPPVNPRRGPGRPGHGLSARVAVRLTTEEVTWLGQEAAATGQTFSEILRAALQAFRQAKASAA
jgi:hypothetical protein